MRSTSLAVLVTVSLAATTAAAATTPDHMLCYKIKDPTVVSALVDLNSAQFGLAAGCKVSKAAQFCVPVSKDLKSLLVNKVPATALPVYGGPPLNEDRICYKVACPKPLVPIAPQVVADQFDSRTVSVLKALTVCTPAVKGSGYCGDGVIDAGEDCDGATALGSCTVGCRSDCTCQCETACCYVESFGVGTPETECFEYSGNPAQITAFGTACSAGAAGASAPGGFPPVSPLLNTWLPGTCTVGPMVGRPCTAGPPGVGNLHVLPSDSTCP